MSLIHQTIKDFEQRTSYKIIYVAISGSRLYGTHSKDSDTDYKGIFIPSKNSLLLKEDITDYTISTGENDSKNQKDDIDIQLWSIHKFFNLLQKGETGALDLLFSMQDKKFAIKTSVESMTIYQLRHSFLHKTAKAFLGYAVGQSQKYGIKGSRYKELNDFIATWENSQYTPDELIAKNSYKYISIVQAPGPRGSGDNTDIPYLQVFDKKFDLLLDKTYILSKLYHIRDSFGARTKAAKEGTDWKSLSNAVRVLTEIRELLQHHHISFPLTEQKYVTSIKQGNESIESVLAFIEKEIPLIDELTQTSALPNSIEKSLTDKLLLEFYHA